VGLWIAPPDVVPGLVGAGAFTGGAAKIGWHSTEGRSYAGARAAYAASGSGPHLTGTFENGRYQDRQHLPLNVAATALLHPAGTGQTNRDNVIQVELVGFAAEAAQWPPAFLAGIADLARRIEAATGCPSVAPLPFLPPGQAPRAGWELWHGAGGHYGHEHVPANNHQDPGAMNIAAVLDQPIPVPTPSAGVPGRVSTTVLVPDEEDEGMAIEKRVYDCGVLDGQGCGGILFDGGVTGDARITHFEPIPWASVRGNPAAHGSFPPDDGHRPLVLVGPQQRAGFLCVEFYGGVPGAPVSIVVDVAT
jgi:hypothetical protein